jgi:RimJ/RimL family protein N-acetyltransferase
MITFETERLIMRPLSESDTDNYFDMMGNPNVMNPVPVKTMNRAESDAHLADLLKLDHKGSKKIWAIDIKGGEKFIGLCAILKNDENDDELGYRFRERYWGVGYGTEATIGLIDLAFNTLGLEMIAADVNTANPRSMKILDKFLSPVREFFNEEGNCTDRRYHLRKEDWSK